MDTCRPESCGVEKICSSTTISLHFISIPYTFVAVMLSIHSVSLVKYKATIDIIVIQIVYDSILIVVVLLVLENTGTSDRPRVNERLRICIRRFFRVIAIVLWWSFSINWHIFDWLLVIIEWIVLLLSGRSTISPWSTYYLHPATP